ncbi:uncharacterized protein LOC131955650 [Physella acuta]|uniref:uncharacterized protein LOC131955650 n=1 Tax=Physella acuta TaxID=109671 RepID=UPI0027DDC634|nr:uncharacterized protein LOC131955650 [Physella acuta]
MSCFAKVVDHTGIELVCNQNLTITNLCLEDAAGANSETTLFLKIRDENFTFSLFDENNLHMGLNMQFPKRFKLSLFTRGPGKVHVLGYYDEQITDEDEEIVDVFEEHAEEKRKSHMG